MCPKLGTKKILWQISDTGATSIVTISYRYGTDTKYPDGVTRAIRVDPGQTLQSAASDQDLHCLLLIQLVFNTPAGGKMDYSKTY